METVDISAERHTSRRRKITAILAGGLVLGVGAAVTLAAWNDSEFATGLFTAGSFNLEGSTDGTTFTDHNVTAGDAAASLTFATNPSNLSPDDAVYSLFSLRVTGNPAELTPVAPVYSDDLTATKLTAQVKQVTSTTCDATTFAASSTDVTATAFDITVGTNVNLCLKVTATGALEQADTGSVTWQWDAVTN